MDQHSLTDLIRKTIEQEISTRGLVALYREPIVGLVAADDPGFARLSDLTGKAHLAPHDLLPGARTVACFFLPFAPEAVAANARDRERAAREWAVAYVETNALIGQITARLIDVLGEREIRVAAEPATGNFDEITLRSHWSHKSIAVLAGMGSFGLHHMVITDAGCAGRFGSLVLDAAMSIEKALPKERCAYKVSGACLDCVLACPVQALDPAEPFDRRACWNQCLANSREFLDLHGAVQVCGKCAVAGPCALQSAV